MSTRPEWSYLLNHDEQRSRRQPVGIGAGSTTVHFADKDHRDDGPAALSEDVNRHAQDERLVQDCDAEHAVDHRCRRNPRGLQDQRRCGEPGVAVVSKIWKLFDFITLFQLRDDGASASLIDVQRQPDVQRPNLAARLHVPEVIIVSEAVKVLSRTSMAKAATSR